MNKLLKVLIAAILIGLLNAFSFLVVEFIDKEGTNFIWNTLLGTDTNRILVIPVAIIFSIIFSSVIILLKQKRIGNVEIDLLENREIKETKIKDILIVFLIGSTGLLAGASLGPEGVLVAISSGIGIYIAQKTKKIEAAKLLILSSVGALLVGFFGSLLPILIPVFILYKKEKKIIPQHLIPPIIAGLSTYLSLYIIKNGEIGFGTIPTGSSYNLQDIIAAFILGIIGAFFALLIKVLINKFELITKKIDKLHWLLGASIFGAVLGILYFLGGQPTQFSGAEGTAMLLEGNGYSLTLLIIMLIAKFLATSWSLPAGYKGGLVFPSIFMAVVISLIFSTIDPALGGAGITIGATSGMMSSMLPPIIGFILIISLIHFSFIPVAIGGLIGAMIGKKIIDNYIKIKHLNIS